MENAFRFTFHLQMNPANYFSALPVVKLYDSNQMERVAGTQINFQVIDDNICQKISKIVKSKKSSNYIIKL